jgi:glycosyltransferase
MINFQSGTNTVPIDNAAPFFSVITIVKNGRQFVEQTIKSVLNQNYDSIEYIVVDGGSTDGTIDIIKSYEHGIRKWISEEDHGIADAFNKGFSLCSGNYILFLNSDDTLADSGIFQTIADRIIELGFPVLVYGDYVILDRESGGELYRGSVPFSFRGMKYGLVPPHPCLFTHRSFFERYGRFDTSFKIAMDYEFMLRGALIENMVHLPIVVSRIRNGGVSTGDRGRTVEEIIRALKKNGHVASRLSEFKMRGYFLLRAVSRVVLNKVGIYKAFFNLRTGLRIRKGNRSNLI